MALPQAPDRPADTRLRLRQIGAVIAGAGVVGLGFSLLYLVNDVLDPGAISAGAALAIGLASGFGARIWLRDSTSGLRVATALAAAVLGQGFLGWVTWGFAGLALTPGRVDPDWAGLLRVALGSLAAVLSLRAWTALRVGTPRAQGPVSPPRPAVAVPPPVRGDRRWARGLDRIRRAVARARGAHVHLTGEVEHRCPYCLEAVVARDPRGEVTCPICHTRHHADCWAVTGVCQVPHHNV